MYGDKNNNGIIGGEVMDIALILLMGLIFCIKSSNAPDTVDIVPEIITPIAIETKLNDTFYVDEHAFEVIANGLNFH